MANQPVPDFFQEETEDALRSQVDWLRTKLGIAEIFFAQFLKTDAKVFRAWLQGEAKLSSAATADLKSLWQTALHLMSFVNFDAQRVKQLIEHTAKASGQNFTFAPPWTGSSMKAYIATHGSSGLAEVDRWVTALRFGDPYAA